MQYIYIFSQIIQILCRLQKLKLKHFVQEVASVQFISVQSLSRVRLFATPLIAGHQASLSITNSQSSLGFTSIESMMPSSHLILGSPFLPSAPDPSQHQSLFQWVSCSHEVAKVLEFKIQNQSFQ